MRDSPAILTLPGLKIKLGWERSTTNLQRRPRVSFCGSDPCRMMALYLYQVTWSAYKRFVPKNATSSGDEWSGEADTSSQKAMVSQFAVLLHVARLQALACRYLPLSRLSVYLSHKTFPCMDCTYPPTFTDIFWHMRMQCVPGLPPQKAWGRG